MQATTIVSCRDLQRYNIGIFAAATQRPSKGNAPVSGTAYFPRFMCVIPVGLLPPWVLYGCRITQSTKFTISSKFSDGYRTAPPFGIGKTRQ